MDILTKGIRKRDCSYCGKSILADEKHIHFEARGYRYSKTENLCLICLKKSLDEVNSDEFKIILNRHLLENI